MKRRTREKVIYPAEHSTVVETPARLVLRLLGVTKLGTGAHILVVVEAAVIVYKQHLVVVELLSAEQSERVLGALVPRAEVLQVERF